MNLKTLFITTGIGAMAALSVSSCQDYVAVDEGTIKQDILEQKYTDAFIERFGTPDPNHDWGFHELEALNLGESRGSRAPVAGDKPADVDVNRNMWTLRDRSSIAYRDGALAKTIEIPGWPHLNGLYYGSHGEDVYKDAYTENDVREDDAIRPIGDITPYEIQYVSAWFRTHKIDDPTQYREDLHLSDFFIQNVCCDNDQKEYKKELDNAWGAKTGWNGDNVTDGNWNADNIWRKENSHEAINYKLDQLRFQSIDGDTYHVNNFNNGNTNYNPEESVDNKEREIMYVRSAGTEDFWCHAVFDDQWINNWVLVHLTWTEKVVNEKSPLYGKPEGEAVQREGYYLAFDFESHAKADTKVDGDHYYSNWIIKITPGNFNPRNKNVKRIFCEDLGGSFDFDFNDVVFDIGFDTNDEAIISVQATGATLPIYVDKVPGTDSEAYEVHRLLGEAKGTTVHQQVNVDDDAFPNTHSVAIYRGDKHTSKDPGDIMIYVNEKKDGSGTWNKFKLGGERYNLTGTGDEQPTLGTNGKPIHTNASKAPRAFAVDVSRPIEGSAETGEDIGSVVETKWMKEWKFINNTYDFFSAWVKNQNNFGLDGTRVWYEHTQFTDNLYLKNVKIDGENPHGESTLPQTWISVTPQVKNVTPGTHAFADYQLTLNAYTETDAIRTELEKFGENSHRQVTFTVILASDTKVEGEDIQTILIPADVKDNGNGTTTLSYLGTDFLTYSSDSETDFMSKAITGSTPVFTKWHDNIYQANYTNTSGKYYYTSKFSFTKDQLKKSNGQYVEYLLFYIKTADGVAKPVIPTTTHNDKTVWEWYVHY